MFDGDKKHGFEEMNQALKERVENAISSPGSVD
jgi:hypothetical protein